MKICIELPELDLSCLEEPVFEFIEPDIEIEEPVFEYKEPDIEIELAVCEYIDCIDKLVNKETKGEILFLITQYADKLKPTKTHRLREKKPAKTSHLRENKSPKMSEFERK